MRRLLVLVPISGLDADALSEREAYVRALAGDGWDVTLQVLRDAPQSIESLAEEVMAAASVIRHLSALGRGPADAIVVWCAGDPGVLAARSLADCPVVGPGEAAMRLAHLLALRFGVITPLPEEATPAALLAAKAGLSDRYVGSAALDLPVLEMRRALEKTRARIRSAAQVLIGRGAGALVLGCMGAFGLARAAQEDTGLPVIDPADAAIRLALMLAGGGYRFSPADYPAPPKQILG